MALELNTALIVTAATAKQALIDASKEGFNTISNGLGLADGEYKFTTKSADYMGIMPVQSRKSGSKLSLTFVLGNAEGLKDVAGINKSFEDRNICVIPSASWTEVEPSTEYVMKVENNYVTSFERLGSGSQTKELTVDEMKAWLKSEAGFKAKDLKDLSDAEVLEAYNDEQ